MCSTKQGPHFTMVIYYSETRNDALHTSEKASVELTMSDAENYYSSKPDFDIQKLIFHTKPLPSWSNVYRKDYVRCMCFFEIFEIKLLILRLTC